MLIDKLVTQFLIISIKAYKKLLSPFLPCVCRHTPSCSEYMLQAILYHGIVKGCSFGVMRILKCQPFSRVGKDDIPLMYFSYFKKEQKA
jgi:putative membrane protein insertion efficiency factor